MSTPARVLVVANRTAESPELLDELCARQAQGPVEVTLVVPASWEVGDPHGGRESARRRMRGALQRMREHDIAVTGVVGDADPMTAFADAWDPDAFDAVIVCTLHSRLSVWLKRDLPRRIEQRCTCPVTHIEGTERAPAPA